MTLAQFGGLFIVYLVGVLFILTLAYQEFRRVRLLRFPADLSAGVSV